MEQASNESLRDLGAHIIDPRGRMHGTESWHLERMRRITTLEIYIWPLCSNRNCVLA